MQIQIKCDKCKNQEIITFEEFEDFTITSNEFNSIYIICKNCGNEKEI